MSSSRCRPFKMPPPPDVHADLRTTRADLFRQAGAGRYGALDAAVPDDTLRLAGIGDLERLQTQGITAFLNVPPWRPVKGDSVNPGATLVHLAPHSGAVGERRLRQLGRPRRERRLRIESRGPRTAVLVPPLSVAGHRLPSGRRSGSPLNGPGKDAC